MIKRPVLLVVVMILSLLMGACQKAKEPEAKHGGTQKAEVKQPPVGEGQPQTQQQGQSGETTSVAGSPVQGQPETQAIPAEQVKENVQTAESQGTGNFKEPVLLWEREFDPPIREISDQNSNGDFLAIQVKEEEGSGIPLMTKLLVIDSKGKTKREETLVKKKNITVPAEQLWLTAYSDEELGQFKKAKKPKTVEAFGKEMYMSGNGEYYATVMQYGGWYEFEYKDKDGKSLWKITPKDNYGFSKAYISHDGSRVVIIDMGGLGGGDEWEVLGQRVYFYDNTGRLLKDYDFGERMEEWFKESVFLTTSPSGKYITFLTGNGLTILLDNNGEILLKKKFYENSNMQVADNGFILFDKRDKFYVSDIKGNILWEIGWEGKERGRAIISPDGKKVLFISKTTLRFLESHTKKVIYEMNINLLKGVESFIDSFYQLLPSQNWVLFNRVYHEDLKEYYFITDIDGQIKWQKEFIKHKPYEGGPFARMSKDWKFLKIHQGKNSSVYYWVFSLNKEGQK